MALFNLTLPKDHQNQLIGVTFLIKFIYALLDLRSLFTMLHNNAFLGKLIHFNSLFYQMMDI